MAKVKHIGDEVTKANQEVHLLKPDGRWTKCGFDTKENPTHWQKVGDSTTTTCSKNGCK